MVKVEQEWKMTKEHWYYIIDTILDIDIKAYAAINDLKKEVKRLTSKVEKLEKKLNKKVVAKTNTVESDMRAAKGTLYQDTIDWVKKFNINVPTFKKYYTTHTNLETGLYFGIDRRYTSKVAKQLGIAKRKFVKRNHK